MLAQKGDVSFVRYDQRTKDHKHHYEHAFPGDIDEMDDKEKHEEEEQLKWSGRFGGECRVFPVSLHRLLGASQAGLCAGGVMDDFRRRLPYWRVDFVDGFRTRKVWGAIGLM